MVIPQQMEVISFKHIRKWIKRQESHYNANFSLSLNYSSMFVKYDAFFFFKRLFLPFFSFKCPVPRCIYVFLRECWYWWYQPPVTQRVTRLVSFAYSYSRHSTCVKEHWSMCLHLFMAFFCERSCFTLSFIVSFFSFLFFLLHQTQLPYSSNLTWDLETKHYNNPQA